MPENLEQLYQEARSALKARDYVRAGELLRQILQNDENYKDASRLLAQTVKLRRRRWYSHPALWGTVVIAAVIGIGIWLSPHLSLPAVPTPTSIFLPTSTIPPPEPTSTVTSEETPTLTPTSIPLTWKRIYVGQEFERDTVIAFEIDPGDPDILYASMKNAGFYQSIDGGLSWHPVQIENVPGDISKRLIVNNDNNQKWDFIVSNTAPDGERRVYRGGSNWYISENGGKSWREFGMIGQPHSGAITFDTAGAVFTFCDLHLCKYNPDGTQRVKLGQPNVGAFTIITISPFDPNTIYIAGDGISASKDGGVTWKQINNGLGGEILKLDISKGPTASLFAQSGVCVDETRNNNRDYYGQPLYHSTDGGHTWILSIETGCQLVKDADGSTLYRIGREPGGTSMGWIWRSSDEGKTWKKLNTPDPVVALVAHPTKSGELGIYTEFIESKLYTSIDHGHTWDRKNLLDTKPCWGAGASLPGDYLSRHIAITTDPRDSNHILYVYDGKIYESSNNCSSSSRFNYLYGYTYSIAFDINNPETLYAGKDDGAYISFDSGKTWNEINEGLLGVNVVYSVVSDLNGNVFAATPYGIFKLEKK
jgi:photosystem II stability/assembly factor-like uncharacterized protein